MQSTDELLDELFDSIVEGRHRDTPLIVEQGIEAGIAPSDLLAEGMTSAMAEVGRRFETNECFVPEMMLSARAMQAGLNVLKPHLKGGEATSAGRVAIGTVRGDMHDIGKNLVMMMLEGAGFAVVDLGVDVTTDKFVEAAQSGEVDIIALSALITTTLPAMQKAVAALNESEVRGRIKVMVGGAPVSSSFASQIGADGFAADASAAVTLARALVAPQESMP
jgi:5-methyltetrahydrofolate--homocysteine methyltransferase